MTEREERALGMRIARKNGLKETKKAIKNNECYKVIFQTLVKEAGMEKTVNLLVESKNPYWAYWFAYDVCDFSEETKEKLATVVVEAKNPYRAYCFARDVSGLSRETKEKLATLVIESKNPNWAYRLAYGVFGLSEETIKKLKAL